MYKIDICVTRDISNSLFKVACASGPFSETKKYEAVPHT